MVDNRNQRMKNAGDSVQSNKLLLRNSTCKFLLGAGWGRCKESLPSPHFVLCRQLGILYGRIIDYAKAFDCVDHNKLWKILKEMGIPDHLTCLLRNLFAVQEATVRTGHGTTDCFQIGKRVRQGYILSPCLFNLYAEYIMRNAGLEEAQAGIKISSVQFSCSVMSDSLQPHESQHARPPCPSPTLRVYPNLCPSSRWCHPAISSSVILFSSCPQSFPASGSSPMSQFFSWGGQSTGVPASTSVLPMNTQDWSPLGWTGWISLQSKGLSRVLNQDSREKYQ